MTRCDRPGTGSPDEITDAFYTEHEEDFVSAYAATNVVEDFAESFMLFVLLLFSEYPELVEIRDRIRSEFAGEL